MKKSKLATRIENVSESKSVRLASVIAELSSQGEEIISFNVGEPDFATPRVVIEATKKALDQGLTRYALVPGQPFLRQAIADKLNADQDLALTSENICVSNGSKQILYSIFQLLCDPGDEVIIPAPYWVSFPEAVKLAGAEPIFVETSEGKLDAQKVKAAITDRTKLIILNSPSNPSGLVYNDEEVKRVVALAREHDLYIISDEAYEALVFDRDQFVGPAGLADKDLERTLIVQSFSKSFCMTGFRIGYLAASKEIITAMNKFQSHVCGNIPVFIQKGALAALENQVEIKAHMRDVFLKRRDFAYKLCKAIFPKTPKPEGAFYLFPSIGPELLKKYQSDEALALHILKEAKVALLPGSYFGVPGTLRMAFSTSEENIKNGLKAIEEVL
jgi:aspartate aminotransferase